MLCLRRQLFKRCLLLFGRVVDLLCGLKICRRERHDGYVNGNADAFPLPYRVPKGRSPLETRGASVIARMSIKSRKANPQPRARAPGEWIAAREKCGGSVLRLCEHGVEQIGGELLL